MNLERVAASAQRTAYIGVDGGASGFRAYEIVLARGDEGPRLALGAHAAAEAIEPVAGFTPLPLERQREELLRGALTFSREERVLQGRWIHAASRAVWRVAAASGRDTVRIGLCAPGVKTADGRGIELSLNGPRIPDFVEALEQSMLLDGLNLAEPIDRLASDGLACGLGEDLAEAGALRGVRHGYYLGGGSGVAEAYKLSGTVHSADEVEAYLPKAWQLPAGDGRTFEALLSVSGLNREFGLAGALPEDPAELPENAAIAGDARARALLEQRGERLAELAAARLLAIHGAHGLILERVVVGQRLGKLFLDPRLEHCLAGRARTALAARLAESAPAPVRMAWVANGALAPGRLVGSDLRAAPALGALALALGRD